MVIMEREQSNYLSSNYMLMLSCNGKREKNSSNLKTILDVPV